MRDSNLLKNFLIPKQGEPWFGWITCFWENFGYSAVVVYKDSSQNFCPLFPSVPFSLGKVFGKTLARTCWEDSSQYWEPTHQSSLFLDQTFLWHVFSFISLLLLCTVDLKTFNFLRFRNEGSLLTLDQRILNKSQRAFHKVIIFLVFAFQGFLFRIIMVNYSSNSNCIPSFLNFNFELLFKLKVKSLILWISYIFLKFK